jgi:hypothetical protein
MTSRQPLSIATVRTYPCRHDSAVKQGWSRGCYLTERWESPSAVVDNCIMNVALVAVLRSDVGACRSYAVRVLRIHVIQKVKASSLCLT